MGLSEILLIMFVNLSSILIFLVGLLLTRPKRKKMPHKCCGKCKFNLENDPNLAFRQLFSGGMPQ